MVLLILLIVLLLAFGGAGFAIHALWFIALLVLVAALVVGLRL